MMKKFRIFVSPSKVDKMEKQIKQLLVDRENIANLIGEQRRDMRMLAKGLVQLQKRVKELENKDFI